MVVVGVVVVVFDECVMVVVGMMVVVGVMKPMGEAFQSPPPTSCHVSHPHPTHPTRHPHAETRSSCSTNTLYTTHTLPSVPSMVCYYSTIATPM